MNNIYLDTKNLFLADISTYHEKYGVEVSNNDKKAVVYLSEKNCFNIFNGEEICFFIRSPYPNYTKDGVAYGNKLFLVSNKNAYNNEKCYVENKIDSVNELLKKNDYISSNDLRKILLNSNLIIEGLNDKKRLMFFKH